MLHKKRREKKIEYQGRKQNILRRVYFMLSGLVMIIMIIIQNAVQRRHGKMAKRQKGPKEDMRFRQIFLSFF